MPAKKKNAKKVQPKTEPPLPFNKKNMLAVARSIYSDEYGIISALKLCYGTLSNGKDGGRTTHCAIGEAYFHFVNKNMNGVHNSSDPTEDAIAALVKVAQLKKPSEKNKAALYHALNDAVEENDDESGYSDNEALVFMERSRRVAEVFREKVAPLLK